MTETLASEPRKRQRLALWTEVPAVLVTFVMMLHITANALTRTLFQQPLPNTLEIVQYWYVPTVAFLGFIAAQSRGEHVAADLAYRALPAITKPFVLAAVLVLSSAVSAGFAWYGWGEALHAMDIGKTAGVSTVISWPTYFLVPLAFGSLTLQFLWAAARAIRNPEDDQMASDIDIELILEQDMSDREKK